MKVYDMLYNLFTDLTVEMVHLKDDVGICKKLDVDTGQRLIILKNNIQSAIFQTWLKSQKAGTFK